MSPVEVARPAGRGAPLLGGGRRAGSRGTRASPRRSTGPTGCCRARTAAVRRACRSSRGGADLPGVHAVSPTRCASEAQTPGPAGARSVDRSLVVAVSAPGCTAGTGFWRRCGRTAETASSQQAPTVRWSPARRPTTSSWPNGRRTVLQGPRRAGLGGPDALARLRRTCVPPSNSALCRPGRRPRRPAGRLDTRTRPPAHRVRGLGLGRAGTGRGRMPSTRCYVAAVGAAARGAWYRGDFPLARPLARRATGPRTACGTPRIALSRATSWPTWRCTRATSTVRLPALHRRGAAARREGDRIRLVWTLYYVAICEAVRPRPRARRRAGAREPCASRTRQPTRRPSRWRATRWAWC